MEVTDSSLQSNHISFVLQQRFALYLFTGRIDAANLNLFYSGWNSPEQFENTQGDGQLQF